MWGGTPTGTRAASFGDCCRLALTAWPRSASKAGVPLVQAESEVEEWCKD